VDRCPAFLLYPNVKESIVMNSRRIFVLGAGSALAVNVAGAQGVRKR